MGAFVLLLIPLLLIVSARPLKVLLLLTAHKCGDSPGLHRHWTGWKVSRLLAMTPPIRSAAPVRMCFRASLSKTAVASNGQTLLLCVGILVSLVLPCCCLLTLSMTSGRQVPSLRPAWRLTGNTVVRCSPPCLTSSKRRRSLQSSRRTG